MKFETLKITMIEGHVLFHPAEICPTIGTGNILPYDSDLEAEVQMIFYLEFDDENAQSILALYSERLWTLAAWQNDEREWFAYTTFLPWRLEHDILL